MDSPALLAVHIQLAAARGRQQAEAEVAGAFVADRINSHSMAAHIQAVDLAAAGLVNTAAEKLQTAKRNRSP